MKYNWNILEIGIFTSFLGAYRNSPSLDTLI